MDKFDKFIAGWMVFIGILSVAIGAAIGLGIFLMMRHFGIV